jgi:hypothetical protein
MEASAMTLEDLARMPNRSLERIHRLGTPPSLAELAGQEYCGFNRPASFELLGIRKFIKGFFVPVGGESRADQRIEGYNVAAIQNGIDGRWLAKGDDGNPKRFGFYTVEPTRPGEPGEQYPNALLLDYGASSRNETYDPTRLIRDLLVQVAGRSDLLLGKATLALIPGHWVFSNYFILRHRGPHAFRG